MMALDQRLLLPFVVLLGACSDWRSLPPCQQVGVTYCAKMYECYSSSQRAGFGLPATQSECETQENSGCAHNQPGYCKGSPEVSAEAATACATAIDGQSCSAWKGTPSAGDPCKHGLCSN